MHRLLVTLAALIGLALPAAAEIKMLPATAFCGSTTEIKAILDKEMPGLKSVGADKSGKVGIAFYVSPSGAWALMMVPETNVVCVMASGEHWEAHAAVILGTDA